MKKAIRRFVEHCRHIANLRFVAIAASVLILILFLGLFHQARMLKGTEHYQLISRLRALERTSIMVTTNALKIRLTLLPNYDTVVADSSSFRTQLEELEQSLSPLLPVAETIRHSLTELKHQAADRAVLVEDLKSENAVLQNSVSYLPEAIDTFLSQLSEEETHYQLKALLTQLETTLLRYTLDEDEKTTLEIEQLISQVEAWPQKTLVLKQSAIAPPTIENISQHARAILYRKPQVTDAIKYIANAPVSNTIEQLAFSYEAYHHHITSIQKRYQIALYTATIFLLVSFGYLVWNYRNSVHLERINGELNRLVSDRTQALNSALKTLKHSQSQLVQTEKMSALGQLSAGVAHEINNPITFIYGNVQACERYGLDCLELVEMYSRHYPNPVEEIEDFLEDIEFDFLKEDWSKLFESMKTGTLRVKGIVESLRNFSRLDESDRKAVDLHEGIESTLLLLAHRLKATTCSPEITVIKNYQSLPQVSCYPGAINQVFMNILANAIDAFDLEQPVPHPAPMITISTSTISTKDKPSKVAVTIADNGSGMTEAVQKKMFDPFFTSKPVGKGTGLGLSVSYQTIVEAHAGSIDVTSTLGEGSSFRIQLPIEAQVSGKSQKNEAPPDALPGADALPGEYSDSADSDLATAA